MHPIIQFGLAFLVIAVVVGTGLYIVQLVIVQRRRAWRARLGIDGDETLDRLTDEAAGRRGFFANIDRWFSQLMIESGLAFSNTVALLFSCLGGLIIGGTVLLVSGDVLLTAAGVIVGAMAVIGIFGIFRRRHLFKIQAQFPHSIDLLSRSVRAGYSLENAMELGGQTLAEPLAGEFRRCAAQLEMGLTVNSALAGFARRVPIAEVRILATTLMIQRKTGGNLPFTLRRIAQAMRERLNSSREYRAATAAGRLSAAVIICCALSALVYMLVIQREYIQNFFEFPLGRELLAAAVLLQFTGVIWLSRLARSDDVTK